MTSIGAVDIAQMATRLLEAGTSRTAIDPVSDEVPELDLASGYAGQRELRAPARPIAGWKLGAAVSASGRALRLAGVVLEHNGEVVATASGAASLGHPAAAVAWLARALHAEGEGLRAGEVVLSGGLTAAVPVARGDVVVAS